MTRPEKTSWGGDTPAVLLAALAVAGRAVFHPFKEIRMVYRVQETTPSLTKTQVTLITHQYHLSCTEIIAVQMTMTRLLVTARSPMQGALWSSAVPALPGSTSLVRKWKGLQYLMCGTVHCVKQRVQKVELNLVPGRRGAESWRARERLLETSSDRTIKRGPSDPWKGRKLHLNLNFWVARRGLWYEPPCPCNLWNQTQVVPPRIVSRTLQVIHKDFYQC